MPNRILKESICSSDTIDGLSWFEEAFFYRLIVCCDDFGRFDARTAILKNRLFPLKDDLTKKAVEEAVRKLASVGLVVLYELDGKPYLYLPSWDRHQNRRATKSKYPDPEKCLVITSDINRIQMYADAPVTRTRNTNNDTRNSVSPLDTREAADDALAKVMTYYMENISMTTPSPVVTSEIQEFLVDLEPDVVLHALKIAAERDNHNWPYIKAILNRYKTSGLDTLEKVLLEEKRFQAGKNKTGTADEYTGDITAGWDLIYGKGAENG